MGVEASSLGQKLRVAAKAGDVPGVKEALDNGADASAANQATGSTALHLAVDGLHYDVVKVLLSAGSNVNAQDVKGQSPLHIAAHENDSKMIKLLIDANADQSLLDTSGRTPFKVAREEHKESASEALSSAAAASSRGMIFGHTRIGPNATSGVGEDARVLKGIAEGEQELREAAMDGDVVGVEEVLRLHPGIDIEAVGPQGLTTLYLSVLHGQTDVVEVLLEHGARVDVIGTSQHQTPVHLAAADGDVKLVEILVVSDPSVINKRDKMGRTPLILAAAKGHVDVVRILLELDADCSIVDLNGDTPLLVASASDHVEVVKALLSAPKPSSSELQIDRANRFGDTALHKAALKGNVEVGKLLLQAGANKEAVNKLGATPLLFATSHTQFSMVSLLINSGANPNAASSTWETPLYLASVDGHVNIVKELLQHGANTEMALENGLTPLMAASKEGRIAIIAELLAHGADIDGADNTGATALLIAAREGYSNVVGFLLHNGANISESDNRGFTALHIAAEDGHVGVLKICLSTLHSEAVDNQGWLSSLGHLRADTRGETALHLGARNGHTAIVKELLSYDAQAQKLSDGFAPRTFFGAMVNLPNKFGWAPLHVAVDRAQLGVIDLLIQYEANVNSPDLFGNTPVHLAARLKDQSVMERLLLVPEVDIASVNRRGKGMLHFASSCVRPGTVSMLLDAGADPHAQDKNARKPFDVLNITEECNPSYVENSEIYEILEVDNANICNGDMCPVQMGTADDLFEANSLLKAAMNNTSDNSRVHHVAALPSIGSPGSGLISTPLVISLTPVAFIILIFAIAFAFRQKIHNGRRDRSFQQDKNPQWCPNRCCESCVNAGNFISKSSMPKLISVKSTPRDESPMDQVDRSILSGDHGLFDQVLTSLDCSSYADNPDWNSETSSDAGTCGWSETSSEEATSSWQCSGQYPQGSTSRPNEKFLYYDKTR